MNALGPTSEESPASKASPAKTRLPAASPDVRLAGAGHNAPPLHSFVSPLPYVTLPQPLLLLLFFLPWHIASACL